MNKMNLILGTLGTPNSKYLPLILAPMEDITDPPFRVLCKRLGADVMVSEFISSEGLIRDAVKSLHKLDFSESERPIGIQIFGHDEISLCKAAEVAEKANPDFIDINWGCPVRKIVAKGAGAGILNDIPKMVRITKSVVEAVKLPVTVKTRLGWDDSSRNIVSIAEQLQDVGIAAISIHGRTKAQLYRGVADWTLIGEVKNNKRMFIPVIGNGDIDSPEKAKEMLKYNVDGLMIGRATIGNPWIFKQIKAYLKDGTIIPLPTINERVDICKEHLKSSIEWKGEVTGIAEMRKHYSGYFKGIPDFKPYRIILVTSKEANQLYDTLDEINLKIKSI